MEKRVLDAEARRKLLGLMPFSEEATIDFIPERLKKTGLDAELLPVFQISALTKGEARELAKITTKDAGWNEEELRSYARKHTRGWKNLLDLGTMVEIPFEPAEDGGAKADAYVRIPDLIMADILFEIIKISGLGDPEKLGLKY